MKIMQRNLNRSTFVVWEMKMTVSAVRFKFRCNILISGKIIKEMQGSVASGTYCTKYTVRYNNLLPYNSALRVSAHQNLHQASLLQRLQKGKCICNMQILRPRWPTAWVYGRSPAEIVGSNPTRGMDVCLLWELCVVRWRSLRRADHSSRGVLPTVMCRCVWSRKPKGWGDHGPRWAAAPQGEKCFCSSLDT